MMRSILATSLLAAFCLMIGATPARALELVPAKAKFSANVTSPSLVTVCDGQLWGYSVRTQALLRLNPETGALQGENAVRGLGLDGLPIALACAKNSLLIATQKRADSRRTFALYRWPLKGAASAARLPGTGLVRDLFCASAGACYVVRDAVFRTSDAQSWTELKVPPARDIPNSMLDPKDNPFADWQDRFIITAGSYFRGAAAGNRVFLLDPLRASVVAATADKPGEATKWGRWGVWEGRFMSPKGITLLGDSIVAVSDVGLKLLFFFTLDGQYLGSAGADGAGARFGYPLDLASSGDSVYVADFTGNKIIGLKVTAQPKPEEKTPENITEKAKQLADVLRKNLYRDPSVLKGRVKSRCLSCHDGLEINSLDKFMDFGKHHPVNVAVRALKIDLPLENGKLVTCSSCHDAHHGAGEGDGPGKQKRLPYMLRKPVKDLCVTCHAGRDTAGSNHINMNPAQSCAECHSMHVSQDYLLKERIPDLCVSCHGKDTIPASHPFSPDMVSCVSCHSLHNSDPKLSFAAHAKPANGQKPVASSTCFGCHDDKKALVGKSIHLGTEAQGTHPWPKDEAMCLDCHNPHKKPAPIKQMCASCHGTVQGGEHPVSIESMEGTDLAKGIQLKKSKIVCGTCHEPHGSVPPTPEGRSFFRDPTKVQNFCAGCHGEQAADYYKNFHGRKK